MGTSCCLSRLLFYLHLAPAPSITSLPLPPQDGLSLYLICGDVLLVICFLKTLPSHGFPRVLRAIAWTTLGMYPSMGDNDILLGLDFPAPDFRLDISQAPKIQSTISLFISSHLEGISELRPGHLLVLWGEEVDPRTAIAQ